MTARNFMIAAGKVNDVELTTVMRTSLFDRPGDERLHWLKQIELALDGYGGQRHMDSAERISNILRSLETELRADETLLAS